MPYKKPAPKKPQVQKPPYWQTKGSTHSNATNAKKAIKGAGIRRKIKKLRSELDSLK
jgi:hypothetical protein